MKINVDIYFPEEHPDILKSDRLFFGKNPIHISNRFLTKIIDKHSSSFYVKTFNSISFLILLFFGKKLQL